jgi:hypothetical protein
MSWCFRRVGWLRRPAGRVRGRRFLRAVQSPAVSEILRRTERPPEWRAQRTNGRLLEGRRETGFQPLLELADAGV